MPARVPLAQEKEYWDDARGNSDRHKLSRSARASLHPSASHPSFSRRASELETVWCCAIGLGFPDLQFHIVIPPKGAPSREFHAEEICISFGLISRLCHVRVDFGAEALGVATAISSDLGEKQFVESGSFWAIGAGTGFGDKRLIQLVKWRRRQLEQDIGFNPCCQFPHWNQDLGVSCACPLPRNAAANASCCCEAGSLAINRAWPMVI